MTREIFANDVDEAIVKLNKFRLEAIGWNFVKIKFSSCNINVKFCNTWTKLIRLEGFDINFSNSCMEMKVGQWKESLRERLTYAINYHV